MIKKDVSIEEYHHGEYKYMISASALKHARVSTKAYMAYKKSKGERKAHLDFGNAFELALVEPSKFNEKVKVFDADERPEPDKNFGSKANKEWKAGFFDDSRLIINKNGDESLDTIQAMVSSCFSDNTIRSLVGKGEYQNSFFWARHGMELKTRPDLVIPESRTVIDIKTIDTMTEHKVASAIAKYGYDIQAVMQVDGVLNTGYIDSVDTYLWLFVEKKEPYDACLFSFDMTDLQKKYAEYEGLLRKVADSEKTGIYAGISANATDNGLGILTAKIYF